MPGHGLGAPTALRAGSAAAARITRSLDTLGHQQGCFLPARTRPSNFAGRSRGGDRVVPLEIHPYRRRRAPQAAGRCARSASGRMKENGLKNEEELQSYFIAADREGRMTTAATSLAAGTILQANLENGPVMSWRGSKGGNRRSQGGQHGHHGAQHPLLSGLSSDAAAGVRAAGTGEVPAHVRQVYALDPYEQLTPDERKYILGVQGNLWTEYIPDFRQVKHMLLPRLAAIAETGWATRPARVSRISADACGSSARSTIVRATTTRPISSTERTNNSVSPADGTVVCALSAGVSPPDDPGDYRISNCHEISVLCPAGFVAGCVREGDRRSGVVAPKSF